MPNQTPDYRISHSRYRFLYNSIKTELNLLKKHPKIRESAINTDIIKDLEHDLIAVGELYDEVKGG